MSFTRGPKGKRKQQNLSFEQMKLQETIAFVKSKLNNAEAGHDWFHVERVWKNATYLLQHEPANEEVVVYAALLHDIADSKFHGGDEEIGPSISAAFLQSLGVRAGVVEHVVNIIRHMSYRSGLGEHKFYSHELGLVQDADRLDAIGAIGIARAFHYGGFKNRKIYDPNVPIQPNQSKDEYKSSTAPTINHFYEKLFLLKDMMNTDTAKKIAEQRHVFMEQFLGQFYAEWEGINQP